MADIKIKEKTPIKAIDKTIVGTQKVKDNLISIKDKADFMTDANSNDAYNSPEDYATQRIKDKGEIIANKGITKFEQQGRKAVRQTKDNIKKYRNNIRNKQIEKRISNIKSKDKIMKVKSKTKAINNNVKRASDLSKKAIKTSQKAAKKAAKATKESIKASQKMAQATKELTKRAIQGTKIAIKATIATIKSIVSGAKALISLIIAGGWISVIIILVICIFGGFIALFNRNGSAESANMWNGDVVKVAESQIGVTGGDPYWSWYGFDSRVEWCACFVSWCADQCGYLEGNYIIEKPELDQSGIEEQTVADEMISFPKYSVVGDGIQKFKDKNMWQDRNKDGKNYIPRKGDIIFFDWEVDGSSDHTGIVEYYDENVNKVHTIEGNSGDMVKRQEYDLTDERIIGYGTPFYFYK